MKNIKDIVPPEVVFRTCRKFRADFTEFFEKSAFLIFTNENLLML